VAATDFIVQPNASISANNNALETKKGSGMSPEPETQRLDTLS